MTKEQIEQNVEAYRAWLEGKTIQCLQEGNWIDLCSRSFHVYKEPTPSGVGALLRIKPQPTLRPWKAEEIPHQALFHRKSNVPTLWDKICGIHKQGDSGTVWFSGPNEFSIIGLLTLLDEWEYSTDNGVTWKPCGVYE